MAQSSSRRDGQSRAPGSRRTGSSNDVSASAVKQENANQGQDSRPRQASTSRTDLASQPPSRPRQLSAAEFQARTAVAAAASVQVSASSSGGQRPTMKNRSESLLPAALVSEAAETFREGSKPAVDSRSPGSSTLRHASGPLARLPSLSHIPEVLYEPDSPRYKRSQLQQAPARLEQEKHAESSQQERSRRLPSDELSKALPRGLDPATGRLKEDRQSRPSLPYIFGDDRGPYLSPTDVASPSQEFPNPHTPIPERDFEMSTASLQRRVSGSTLPPHMRTMSQQRMEIPPTPPLAVPAAPFGLASSQNPISATPGRPFEDQGARASASHQSRTVPYDDGHSRTQQQWSSDGSTPTPTASSVAADRARREKLKDELIPIQLIHPSAFVSSSPAPAADVGAAAQSQQRPETDRRIGQSGVKPSASGANAGTQAKKQVARVRTDFQNLKRIPKSVVESASSSKPGSIRSPLSQTESGSTFAGVTSTTARNAVGKTSTLPGPSYGQRSVAVVGGSGIEQTNETTLQAARATESAQNAKLLSVGGHVLGTSKAKLLSRKDGSARPIYSPTPLTVAAARKHGLEPAQAEPDPSVSAAKERAAAVPSALPTSTAPPSAPQLPHQIRFRRSEPDLTSSEASRPRGVAQTPPLPEGSGKAVEQSYSQPTTTLPADELRSKRMGDFSGSSMLQEANRRLFLYQRQQDEENRARAQRHIDSVKPAPKPEIAIRVEAATDDGEKDATSSSRTRAEGTDTLQRRHSTRSERRRRESFGSASTAFDEEEYAPGMQKSLSGRQLEKRRSDPYGDGAGTFDADRKLVARRTVDPPSDVIEVKEPSEGRFSGSHSTTSFPGAQQTQLVIDTRADDLRDPGKSDFRFIPILNLQRGKAARPKTGNTRVSFRSGHSREGRTHNAPACRQCFRAGFDCALNLQLGEGTAGRRAFQDFVAAGGLQAISIRDGAAQEPSGSLHERSVTVGDALGRNYVDKLGEVAFGESALSRPVTRGMIDNLLEEKQERESRDRLLNPHKPWLADLEDDEKDDAAEAPAASKMQDRRMSQATLRDEPAVAILRNLEEKATAAAEPAEGRKPDIDPADYDSLSDGTASDDLEYLADRWTLWRKVLQMFVLGIYVFALQALGSGYTTAIPSLIRDFQPGPTLLGFVGLGMLAFNGLQASGLLLGCGFVGFGRQRVFLVSLVLIGVLCVIAGFSSAVLVTLALQALLGYCSGVILYLTLASLVDMFATYTSRLLGLMILILAVATGQLAGPWIARLIIANASWPWQYWSTLIFSAVMVVVVGIVTKETNPTVLFRRQMHKLRREDGLWTPEPQPQVKLGHVFREDLLRPFRVLASSWTIPLLTVSATFFVGVFVFMYASISRVFVDVHGLSATQSDLASTISGVIGVFAAIFALFVIDSRLNWEPDLRTLHIDDKGYIDTTRAERNTERVLIGAMVGAGIFSLSLYTLALTSQMGLAWLFSAFGVVLHTAGVIMVSISVLLYALDSFSPARLVKIHDVTAREEPSSPPASPQGDRDDPYTTAPRSVVRRNSDETVATLNERDKRWSNETALAAAAVMIFLAITVANTLYIPSQQPSITINFQMFAVIFASASLLAIAGPVLLYMYGAQGRHSSIAKLDYKEKVRAWKRHQKASLRTERPNPVRPLIASARASRVVPWISKCLGGDTVISQSDTGAAQVRERARGGFSADGAGDGIDQSPSGSQRQRTQRKELFLGRILADREREVHAGPAAAALGGMGTTSIPSRSRAQMASIDPRAPLHPADRINADGARSLPSRPQTPVLERTSRDLSRLHLPDTLQQPYRYRREDRRPDDHEAEAAETSHGRYWIRGHRRNPTHDGTRTRVMHDPNEIETAATLASVGVAPAGQARRTPTVRGRFDHWIS